MISKVCSIFISILLFHTVTLAQVNVTGKVISSETGKAIPGVEIFNQNTNTIQTTNKSGNFKLSNLKPGPLQLLFFAYQYKSKEIALQISKDTTLSITMITLGSELKEVVIQNEREEVFGVGRLNSVEGTSIFAGKKTEVVLIDKTIGNISSNNARQIYGQVVGLNIYDSNDAGLQLSIGGRGLEPNRTANFNTRQNGYDISADVLGYPESYYTPPAEALQEIQIVRGAASLQYGTQFGGLINFVFKKPANKPLEVVSRQSIGSYNLFTSFNSVSGTLGKFSYYTYYNRKQGDGFRPNSAFNSDNFFMNLRYELSHKTKLSFEATYLDYLAQQAGGLSDQQFEEDPYFSNRTRNWFNVNWKLISLLAEHKFSSKTDLSINFFGLDASRKAVGFRGNPNDLNSNPVTLADEQNNDGSFLTPRDLIIGEFNNWGVETRFLTRYQLAGRNAVLLIGNKYYHAENSAVQGPGSRGTDADFSISQKEISSYPNQSDFSFPNRNLSFFGENIITLNDKLSITPGFRFEYIKTSSNGTYLEKIPVSTEEFILDDTTDNRSLNRRFLLLGLGASYQATSNSEVYLNLSQNYRSVTFSDIRVVSPTFIIDPDIQDEKGFTGDFGIRGKLKETLSFDIGGFGLLYDNRIGIVLDDRANRVRGNIGTAFIYGAETFVSWNIANSLFKPLKDFQFKWFINTSLTSSRYLNSDDNNVKGKKVEFIPGVNLKSGINIGFKKWSSGLQFTYLSEQFTDVENSAAAEATDSRSGVIGTIPSYYIADFSTSYVMNKWTIESGINNMLNTAYFTQRATGYPGPGIIPSAPRTFYLTLQLKL